MSIEQLLIRHGLLAVFLVATVEGDLSLILAGVVAHLGLLDLVPAIVAGLLGNFVGDSAWYALGRWHSSSLRSSRLYARVGPTIESISRRVGVWQLLAARVIYGTRNASMLFWGAHRLPFGRFALVDLLGCTLAATGFALVGYVLSGSALAILGRVKRIEVWLLGALVVAIAVVYVVGRITRNRLQVPPPGADA